MKNKRNWEKERGGGGRYVIRRIRWTAMIISAAGPL
jgi:hypothetical protein